MRPGAARVPDLRDRVDCDTAHLGRRQCRVDHERVRRRRVEARLHFVDEIRRAVARQMPVVFDFARDAVVGDAGRTVEVDRNRREAVAANRVVDAHEVGAARERHAVDHRRFAEQAIDFEREQRGAERGAFLGKRIRATREHRVADRIAADPAQAELIRQGARDDTLARTRKSDQRDDDRRCARHWRRRRRRTVARNLGHRSTPVSRRSLPRGGAAANYRVTRGAPASGWRPILHGLRLVFAHRTIALWS